MLSEKCVGKVDRMWSGNGESELEERGMELQNFGAGKIKSVVA